MQCITNSLRNCSLLHLLSNMATELTFENAYMHTCIHTSIFTSRSRWRAPRSACPPFRSTNSLSVATSMLQRSVATWCTVCDKLFACQETLCVSQDVCYGVLQRVTDSLRGAASMLQRCVAACHELVARRPSILNWCVATGHELYVRRHVYVATMCCSRGLYACCHVHVAKVTCLITIIFECALVLLTNLVNSLRAHVFNIPI